MNTIRNTTMNNTAGNNTGIDGDISSRPILNSTETFLIVAIIVIISICILREMYKDLCKEFCTEACKKDKPQQKKYNDYELENYFSEDTVPPVQDTA